MHKPEHLKTISRGSITPAILIIASAFIIVIYGLLFVLALQLDFSQRQTASESALNVAEAGINYYRWHLAHNPEDYQDDTGGPGPYIHEYLDPQGASIGSYSLEITPPTGGSQVVTIESTGWTNRYPNIKRKIRADFGSPSFAKYSFIQNASTWFGANITVNGQVHSNNGIRMDGTNTSLVTSSKDEYQCGWETGCSTPTKKPGVWGAGANSNLWKFPVPAVDFNQLSFDFAQMKTNAQTEGLYLEPTNKAGYHLVFAPNGTVTVNTVDNTDYYYGYNAPGMGLGQNGQGGCHKRYQVIANETLVGVYNLADTPIIFAEDNLWVEGTVKGKTTVVAVRFPIQSHIINIWIPNSIIYTTYNGSDSLGLIAGNDIYFGMKIPNNFQIDAALMTQNGRVIRHAYIWWCGGTTDSVKNSLTINGSLITYEKSYWNWGDPPQSGFTTRTVNYDTNLLFNPPPYFPTSGDYEFLNWKED